MEAENKGEIPKSKLSNLISQEGNDVGGLQVSVYYSEDNWETLHEINLVIEDKTTVNQLIDASIDKFKNELFLDNIEKKQFKVMLFKKKTKKPNDEYPICSPESEVKTFGKKQFCLVEESKDKENKDQPKEEEKTEKTNENNNTQDIKKDTKKDKKEDTKKGTNKKDESETGEIFSNNDNLALHEINAKKEQNENDEFQGYKKCGGKCISCSIF